MGWVRSLLSVFEDKRELLDPACFEDELALQIDWTPLVQGGNQFCTHRARLRQGLTGSTLTFEVTPVVLMVGGFVVVLGLVLSIGLLAGSLQAAQAPWAVLGTLAISGLAGFSLWRICRRQVRFDQSTQLITHRGHQISLRDVHALQLLREFVQGNNKSYDSYEINLVCSDGRRLNVTDHGTLHAIREDAHALADFLGVPIWDAIDFRLPEHLQDHNPKLEILRMNLFG